ncbi:MAG: DUF433 domain-containing protein [Chloroflexota bacterium]|nr:DUF433 domain-containing protein [Chloroflexota bacterium]MDE2910024.1 DUF433 domain-containing protein [Chloroflexota bacterium]
MRITESINLIWRRPGCRGGRATLIGRGIKVKHIVTDYLNEDHYPSPETIAQRYAATLPQVYAALAYYYENQSEIDDEIAADRRFSDLLNTQGPDAAVASLPPPIHLDEPIIESLHLISRDTDRRHGSPCIEGTSVRVADVVVSWRYREKHPNSIAEKYDLSLGQVFGALAYYHERPTEIEAEIEYERYLKEQREAGLVPV